MKSINKILVLTILILTVFTLGFSEGTLSPVKIIEPEETTTGGHFVSFYVSKFDRIYVVDKNNNEIFLMDPKGNILNTSGGYGWQEGLFDGVSDISSNDDLNYYIADYNNQRIQRYDKQLNYVGILGGGETEFDFYPRAIEVSRFDKLFILDDEKEKVLCFTPSGRLVTEFGGVGQEEFNIRNPVDMKLGYGDKVIVLEEDRILTFDRMGTAKNIFNISDSLSAQSITSLEEYFIFTTQLKDQIYLYNTDNNSIQKFRVAGIQNAEKIITTTLDEQYLYVLTSNGRILLIEKTFLKQFLEKEDVSH